MIALNTLVVGTRRLVSGLSAAHSVEEENFFYECDGAREKLARAWKTVIDGSVPTM